MAPNDFAAVHAALRTIMLQACDARMAIARDEPGDLVVRTAAKDAKGQPGWFGTATIKKSYVAYHLMPLYDRPDLADGLSQALAKRRQGKTCFNFKRVEPELFAELAELTLAARGTVPPA